MNCQETQANILHFIQRDLPQKDMIPFIDHVMSCSECMDELEIYYITAMAMQEIDEGETLTGDYRQALLNELDDRYEELEYENERSNLILMAVFAVMLVAFIAFFIWFIFY